jgi:hypothetical protein
VDGEHEKSFYGSLVSRVSDLSAATFAQTSNSTLGGTVSDSMGARLPGVSIAAANTRTGIVTTVLTNESGAYQFSSLQPGNYKVIARLSEFQTQSYADVSLGVSHQVRLNFALQAGAGEQSLETTIESNSLLATSSSSTSFVLPEQKIRDLPSQYRNTLDLIQTTPAVRSSNVAGGRISQVNTSRDGISVNDGRYDNGIYSVNYVSTDLVDEMRIILAPVDAEFGRGSRHVQLSTRSGSNAFRGSVFWTNHNSAFDANNWFSNFRGQEPDYLNRNQFGGRFGGPVFKNKTFFFFLYEGQRVAQRRYVTGSGSNSGSASRHLPLFSWSPERECSRHHSNSGPVWKSRKTRRRDRRPSFVQCVWPRPASSRVRSGRLGSKSHQQNADAQ